MTTSTSRTPRFILIAQRPAHDPTPVRVFDSQEDLDEWFSSLEASICGPLGRPRGVDFASVCQASGLEAIGYDAFLRSVTETTELDPDELIFWVAHFSTSYASAVAAHQLSEAAAIEARGE